MSNELVEENLGLVHFVAHRWKRRNTNVEYDELFQIGCIGLIKAARKFKPELGFKFATYAVPIINGDIQRYFRDHRNLVHIPRSTAELSLKVVRQQMQECSAAEIADRLACDAEAAERAKTVANLKISSLESPIQHSEDGVATDLLDSLPYYEDFSGADLDGMMSVLTARERDVARYRSDGMNQDEIGRVIGVTQVQVHRILKRIKAKLERYLEAG